MARMKSCLMIGLAALLAAGMGSCIMDPDPLPEMPYRPRKVTETAPKPTEQPAETTSWEEAPAADGFITPPAIQPAPRAQKQPSETKLEKTVVPVPEPTPQTIPDPTKSESEPATEPQVIKLPVEPATTQTTETKAETPPPAAATASMEDLQQITNTGPIPTAARVEGDPTRVWNPLDPSKKIRIINPKTNQPYPSGKKLKVRGTNFQFYVP